jgi:uncharacterized protein (TIGR03083 family)
MDYATTCDRLESEGARFVEVASNVDPSAPVPSCPGWTVADVLAHVGFIHRWAQYLVKVRASERISARDMGLSRGPVTASWLGDGLFELLTTLRASDPDDAMWAWGADQHVRFWARRQLHETLIHRVDLELAGQLNSEIGPEVALDAIDEFLANLGPSGAFSPAVMNLVGGGEVIAFDTLEGARWAARLTGNGCEILGPVDVADAWLRGPADEVLRVLYRRQSLGASSLRVEGRGELVEKWIENSALL